MSSGYNYFLSNRVEVLYENFKSCLFEGTSPFDQRIVIVPSPAMKTWLTVRLAEDPSIAIASGIEFYTLEGGVEAARSATAESLIQKSVPTTLELTLKIEVEIRKTIDSYHTLPSKEQSLWAPLLHYLKIESTQKMGRRGEKRLALLSEKLAHLFKQYGRYGGQMLKVWEEDPFQEWQSLLWNRLFNAEKSIWTYPYTLLDAHSCKENSGNVSFHLFALSYLSALQHRFLGKISANYPVFQYLLSPCAHFWSDIRSDREMAHLTKLWRERGAADSEQKQLEELLRDRNSLLANFGRLGREMALQIEESVGMTEERYVIDPNAAFIEAYEENLHDELYDDNAVNPNGELTLLHALQTDMTLLRNPENCEKIGIKKDDSVQVHVAPNRMREVEILYDTIMRLIDQHAKNATPITPGDIIVLAPDISEYEPYIKAVFNSKSSLLDCQIMDLKAPSQSIIIKSFLHLLTLPASYWDAKVILSLFEMSPFQKKHRLADDDVQRVKEWVKSSGIRWGENMGHRDELLKRDHCVKGMFDKSSVGTWEEGISRLIRSLVCSSELSKGNSPLTESVYVYASQSDLLGKLILLLRSLREDAKLLSDRTTMTMEEWATYFECLYESYFSADSFDQKQLDEEKTLLKHIQAMRHASNSVRGEKFSFNTVHRLFIEALMKEEVCYRESHLQTVKFCSMLPMRAVPSRIVALIGMCDGEYPKQDLRSSLNAMLRYSDVDYCPSQIDYDRYLFLEILLSARDHIILSYPAQMPGVDTEVPPSLLVTELLSYIDHYYTIDNKKTSESCLYKHPFNSFDAQYFAEDSRIRSYCPQKYRSAISYYHNASKQSKPFIESYSIKERPDGTDGIVIDLKHLSACMKNPLKMFFNKTLGIYFDSDEERDIKVEENFDLSALDRYSIHKTALKNPLEHAMNIASAEGKLPFGLFKDVAMNKLRQDFSTQEVILKSAGIDRGDFFEIELSEQCESIIHHENVSYIVPPLKIPYNNGFVTIIGKVHEVTPEGLIPFIKDSADKIIGIWPEYLVLCALIDKYDLPIKKQVIPLRGKKFSPKSGLQENPIFLLKEIIHLYLTSLKNISPLIPEWIHHILNEDSEALNASMDVNDEEEYQKTYNNYLTWIRGRTHSSDTKELIEEWKPHAEHAFNTLFTEWYPPKHAKNKDIQ